jgi:hypothetical protein
MFMLDLPSQFEEVVRSNLPRDSSGRGATLAYRITPHYEQLEDSPLDLGLNKWTHVLQLRYGSLDVRVLSG